MHHPKVHYWRITATALGLGAASLGCYGAYEFALKLEGGQLTYLVIAGPVVAAFAALIPPMAEGVWRQGEYVKALLWWVALFPAVAVVFFSAAERVHVAKSGAKAELSAYSQAATRAEETLAQAKAEHVKAQAEADKTRAWKKCGPQCVGIRDTEAARLNDVKAAEAALLSAQKLAKAEAPIQAPVWLLPAALDLVAFMAIWTGLAGPWVERSKPVPASVAVKAKPRVKVKPTKKPSTKIVTGKLRAIPRRAANDPVGNVVDLHA